MSRPVEHPLSGSGRQKTPLKFETVPSTTKTETKESQSKHSHSPAENTVNLNDRNMVSVVDLNSDDDVQQRSGGVDDQDYFEEVPSRMGSLLSQSLRRRPTRAAAKQSSLRISTLRERYGDLD